MLLDMQNVLVLTIRMAAKRHKIERWEAACAARHQEQDIDFVEFGVADPMLEGTERTVAMMMRLSFAKGSPLEVILTVAMQGLFITSKLSLLDK